jgi:hypothetical protein
MRRAKEIKTIERVKTLVGKLSLFTSSKSERMKKDRGKEKAVDEGPMSQQPDVAPPNLPTQEELGRLPAQTMSTEASQPSEPTLRIETQIPPEEKRPQGDHEDLTTQATDPSLTAKPNSGASKILGRILALLACHKGGGITN